MKKIISISIIICIVLLTGCDKNIYHWDFNYSSNQVEKIQIVEVYNEYNYSVIQDINDELIDEIYNDIIKITMRRYVVNLITPHGVGLLIAFNNGEYDIITKKEPKHYKYNGERISDCSSWLYCDASEFDKLIDKYLT